MRLFHHMDYIQIYFTGRSLQVLRLSGLAIRGGKILLIFFNFFRYFCCIFITKQCLMFSSNTKDLSSSKVLYNTIHILEEEKKHWLENITNIFFKKSFWKKSQYSIFFFFFADGIALLWLTVKSVIWDVKFIICWFHMLHGVFYQCRRRRWK